MSFLIDTNICSAYLRGDGRVHNRFIQYSGGLHVSTIIVGELYTWGHRARSRTTLVPGIHSMLRDMVILDVDENVAAMFGTIRASLLDRGVTVPGLDLFIAATALYHDLTLVTHNTKDFAVVPGLRLLDWTVP